MKNLLERFSKSKKQEKLGTNIYSEYNLQIKHAAMKNRLALYIYVGMQYSKACDSNHDYHDIVLLQGSYR